MVTENDTERSDEIGSYTCTPIVSYIGTSIVANTRLDGYVPYLAYLIMLGSKTANLFRPASISESSPNNHLELIPTALYLDGIMPYAHYSQGLTRGWNPQSTRVSPRESVSRQALEK